MYSDRRKLERIIQGTSGEQEIRRKPFSSLTGKEKVIEILRWLAAIALVKFFIIIELARILEFIVGDMNMFWEVMANLLMGAGVVIIGAMMAPRHRRAVSVVILVWSIMICFFIATLPLMISGYFDVDKWAYTQTIFMPVGAISATFIVFKVIRFADPEIVDTHAEKLEAGSEDLWSTSGTRSRSSLMWGGYLPLPSPCSRSPSLC